MSFLCLNSILGRITIYRTLWENWGFPWNEMGNGTPENFLVHSIIPLSTVFHQDTGTFTSTQLSQDKSPTLSRTETKGGGENCRLSDVDLHYAVFEWNNFLACFMTARGQARIKLIYQLWTITVYTLPLSPPEPITNHSELDPRPRSTENLRFIATKLTNEMKIFLSMKTGMRKSFFLASKEGWGARGVGEKLGKGSDKLWKIIQLWLLHSTKLIEKHWIRHCLRRSTIIWHTFLLP